MTYKTTFFSVHPIDPFGSKVGGIETHVRQLLKYCPAGMRLILIGVDDSGKRKLGELAEVEMFGGRFLFMPILHCHEAEVNAAAKSLLVALISLTSTLRVTLEPKRSNSPVCSTRSSLAWPASDKLPISSKNTLPPSAASKRPMRVLLAPL